MATAANRWRKQGGGGFLNNTTGEVVGYKFDQKKWGEGDDAYHTLSVELLVKPEGATEAVQQFLPAGFFYPENQTISKDGRTLGSDRDGSVLQENTEFTRFIDTLVEACPALEEKFIAADFNNFDAMLGARVVFAKEQNKERQLASGKKKLGKKAAAATEEEIMLAGRRQDPNDKKKFYNQDRLIVTKVLALSEGKAAKGAATATKAKATKAAPVEDVAEVAADVDNSQADDALITLLGNAKGNTIKKAVVGSLMMRYAQENNIDGATRDAIRKVLQDEAYLADAVEREIITYEGGVIGLP